MNMVHPFDETFTSESGAKLLQQLTFSQEKTKIGYNLFSSLNILF